MSAGKYENDFIVYSGKALNGLQDIGFLQSPCV